MKVPGFTAEASLHQGRARYTAAAAYQCVIGHATVAMPLEPTVVPQLPFRVGRVYGPCNLSVRVLGGAYGIGRKTCTDFTCDLQTFACSIGDSETVWCWER